MIPIHHPRRPPAARTHPWRSLLIVALIGSSMTTMTRVQALPPGFVDEFVGNARDAIDLLFLPVPSKKSNNSKQQQQKQQAPLLVTEKSGYVNLYANHEQSGDFTRVADFTERVCTEGARGLMHLEHHPRFGEPSSGDDVDLYDHRWIYVYYTWKRPHSTTKTTTPDGAPPYDCINRVSRFRVAPDDTYQFLMDSEQVLLTLSGPMIDDLHLGSAMVFANDGNLWITVGDNGHPIAVADFQRWHNLLGKLIRIAPDGSVPADNPFVGDKRAVRCHEQGGVPPGSPSSTTDDTVCAEIYARGLRSPFQMAANPNFGNKEDGGVELWISDVGGMLYEEINAVGTDHPGVNYGWPYTEGPCDLRNGSSLARRVCTAEAVQGFEDPVHWYAHDDFGGAVVGGAFVPRGIWPAEYEDTFIFSDYTDGVVYVLSKKDEDAGCRDCPFPTSGYQNSTFFESERVVTMLFGPYQDETALYVLSRRSGLSRIRFTGGLNVAPTAMLFSGLEDTQVLEPGETVGFDAGDSSDPDSPTLFYSWNFGDGSKVEPPSPIPFVEHAYEITGVYDVVVTVSDGDGGSNQARIQIQVGRVPTVTMVSPIAGSSFAVGDVFDMIGEAVDGDGNPMPDSSLSWEIRRHHSTHFHPWLAPIRGNRLSSRPAPMPEDFLATTNSYIEMLLTATDQFGLSSTVTIDIYPRTVLVNFAVFPPVLMRQEIVDFRVFGYVVSPPEHVVMWEKHRLEIQAPDDIPGYSFVEWSDGGDTTHIITIPSSKNAKTGPSTLPSIRYVARYRADVIPPPDGLVDTNVTDTTNVSGGGSNEELEPLVFINCGSAVDYDDGSHIWKADIVYVQGGASRNTRIRVKGTKHDALYQKRRQGGWVGSTDAIVYNIPVPNKGTYQVELHFAEMNKFRPSIRVFTVKIEDVEVLPSFDIIANGGLRTAIQETITTSVTDGILTIELLPEVDFPEISAIAVYAKSSSQPRVPIYEPLIFINCGSPDDYVDIVQDGRTWVSDTNYVQGGARRNTFLPVTNTDNPLLIKMRRQGSPPGSGPNIVYSIPVPTGAGQYKVELYFAEMTKKQEDFRIFTVKIEDVEVLPKYDVFARAGFRTTIVEEISTVVLDGELSIELVAEVYLPEISAIAVYKSDTL